ncbi:hypothetical protein KUV65_11745 [Maritalea mobilis]|uniref:hypothetical protein n=1 Tax=Maritalea mobilis TaxID=483324 RepID=UPI001C96B3DA|nr:hypothetical protein [Maritalea mobilis]MBY6202040.1 hypothetical protein [Maritalea mobilis]
MTDRDILIGIATAVVVRLFIRPGGRPVPGWLLVPIALGAAFVVPPSLAGIADALHRATWLPTVTFGAAFIGGWVGLLVLTIAERKGQPRRVPIWAGVVSGVLATFLVPPLLDLATGRYQNASLRADVNHCTRGMTGQVQPREVSNLCDFDIVVGLCMPGEVNPTPCAQAFTIPPGESAVLDPGDTRLSSVPGNPNGLTVVACRPPDRPSRWGNVTGRGYRGVCLPPG